MALAFSLCPSSEGRASACWARAEEERWSWQEDELPGGPTGSPQDTCTARVSRLLRALSRAETEASSSCGSQETSRPGLGCPCDHTEAHRLGLEMCAESLANSWGCGDPGRRPGVHVERGFVHSRLRDEPGCTCWFLVSLLEGALFAQTQNLGSHVASARGCAQTFRGHDYTSGTVQADWQEACQG